MDPLLKRQYGQRRHMVGCSLTRNLLRRYSAVGNIPHRLTPYFAVQSIGAHTDEQGYGHIAAVRTLFGTEKVSLHLPTWFAHLTGESPSESPIFPNERCAAVLMARVALSWPRDQSRSCVLCVDSQAAVAALVKGDSSSPLGTVLVCLFWSIAARGAALWRIEYAEEKSNIADPSPRVCALPTISLCVMQSGAARRPFP